MNRIYVLTQLQALIDELYINGYKVDSAKLVVRRDGESLDTLLKLPKPSADAVKARDRRLRNDDSLPF